MSTRSPKLRFTKEELEAPAVKRAAAKADKAKRKLDKAEAKIPKKAAKPAERVIDPDTGESTVKLAFQEKTPPVSGLARTATVAPGIALSAAAHRKVSETEHDNVGVESAQRLSETAEGGVRLTEAAYRNHRLRPYRNAEQAAVRADRANLSALNKAASTKDPQFSSNPFSRMQQRRQIKQQYAAAKRAGADAINASEVIGKAGEKAAAATKKAGEFVRKHKKGFLVVGMLAVLLVMFMNMMSSCSVLTEGALGAVGISTYPSSDDAMLGAEAAYCQMEAELQEYLDNYESTHDYDEYHYDLDSIQHDPYVLISMITALKGGEWTLDEVQGILSMLFEKQYILTENVTTETRYRTETRTGTRTVTDPETGESSEEEYEYDVEVPYTYYICTVTLENFNLSHVPVYIMSQDQLSMYATYMATLGNRSDLFPTSAYVGRYNGSYQTYEIPPEALADETFAAMMAEAEKYLGYPYVWGGSSPSTSFDCSGFVSWVINHSGWNVGRLGAQGLYNICTPVSPANARPGDLVFFQGTYDTDGMSHVGIYVGNSTMLHCGDPISFTNLNSSYWQAHFAAYGRLP